MYSVKFENDNGLVYVFGSAGGNIFDMDLGESVPIDIDTAQGFSGVGEVVQSRSVRGRKITAKGHFLGNAPAGKKQMQRVITPFASGRLVIDGNYSIRVIVQDPPSFSPVRDDSKFMLRFFAPYPYFYSIEAHHYLIGVIEPSFSFPINYAKPHAFGQKSAARYVNIYNDGAVSVPYRAHLVSTGVCENPRLVNLSTGEHFQLIGTMILGDTIDIYRDSNSVLRVERTRSGETSDILSWLTDDSNLFDLRVGDNMIAALDSEDGLNLSATLSFAPAWEAVYED